jgi:hypothetical protein
MGDLQDPIEYLISNTWRYCTTFLAIFSGDIPKKSLKNRPKISGISGIGTSNQSVPRMAIKS